MDKVLVSCEKGEETPYAKNQAKLRSYRTSPKHKVGNEIPHNNYYDDVVSIDKNNGNHKWADCVKL